MSETRHCPTCACAYTGSARSERGCPACGSEQTIYTLWSGHNDNVPRWWLVAGAASTNDPAPIDFCPACGLRLTEPCGIGGCGSCHETVTLYENPHGAVARCAKCRAQEDAEVFLEARAAVLREPAVLVD